MEQFDIIGALESYSLENGWKFVYGVNRFERNISSVKEFNPDELILMCDFRATPIIINGRIVEISYTCLMMLGRKIDFDGQVVDLDETNQQKYDRRIKELMQLLSNSIAQIGCENQLDVDAGTIIVEVNLFDENIDFATAQSVTYTQSL